MRLYAIAAALGLGLSGCSYFFPSCQTIPDCPAGQVLCTNASCADLANDPQNCGACARVCAPGYVCIPGPADAAADGGPGPGTCGCPAGLVQSDGQCLDLAIDNQNCGSVGTACQGGESCLAGQCRCPGLDAGVNLETDDGNCGACGSACAAAAACQTGSCICPDGTTQCGAACCGTEGPCDAGLCLGAVADGGSTDGGLADAGSTDAGPSDGGAMDAGPTDAGPTHAGLSDAGLADAGDAG
jgi:hypothetical protein